MVGAYEREAIRPYVLGRFGDMLAAVESHPGMLFYLDNVRSMGGASIDGINRDKGLNENLAREILELHTLGVRSGYTQADVTSFANVLTGWSWIEPAEPDHGGEFVFNKRLHEPGDQAVLGKTYPDEGVAQGRAVLADLARNESTSQHVAVKFARHFVADEPPPSLVAKLKKSFEFERRQSESVGEDAGDSRRGVGAAANKTSAPLRMDCRDASPRQSGAGTDHRHRSARVGGRLAQHRPLDEFSGRSWPAALAAAGAQRLARYRSRLDRWRAASAWHRQRDR